MLTVSLVHKFCGQLVLNPFLKDENPRFSAGSRPVPKFVAHLNRTANLRAGWKSESSPASPFVLIGIRHTPSAIKLSPALMP
jgi:hypothetical protein